MNDPIRKIIGKIWERSGDPTTGNIENNYNDNIGTTAFNYYKPLLISVVQKLISPDYLASGAVVNPKKTRIYAANNRITFTVKFNTKISNSGLGSGLDFGEFYFSIDPNGELKMNRWGWRTPEQNSITYVNNGENLSQIVHEWMNWDDGRKGLLK